MEHPGDLTVVEKPLSKREEKRFAELEAILDKNIKAFFMVWFALKEICDSRLYRTADNRTFERYCEEEWDISRRHGYRLIDAAEVIENVTHGSHSEKENMSPIGHITELDLNENKYPPFPINERQARNLKDVAPEHQGEVWQRVCSMAEDLDCRITAKLVYKCVKQFKIEKFGEVVHDITRKITPSAEPKDKPPRISLPLRTSFSETLQILQQEANSGWRNSNQNVVINWLDTLLTAAKEAS